jgi:hypothetical protein
VDPIHLVCCCDQNLALCGEDVSDVPWADDYDQPCPLCCFAFEAEERCGHCGCAGDCGNPIHD